MRVLVVLSALALSCATVAPLTSVPVKDESALAQAVEAFYRAETLEQLRSAVDEAGHAGPDSARFHEIAATFAQLEGREADAAMHWTSAVLDPLDDQPLLHLNNLMAQDFTLTERRGLRALLKNLTDSHPSPLMRAAAAFHLAGMLSVDGEFEQRQHVVEAISNRIGLAWVGTWDNDQGKGFDLELAPELRPALTETYDGRTGPLTWRRDVPTDPRGRYDLLQLMTPGRWSAAFAQGTFTTANAGTYPLLITTSDPLKIWVDGKLVFGAAQLERSLLDQLVIPLKLNQGEHRILVKSAHREGAWFFLARLGSRSIDQLPPVTNTEQAVLAHVALGSAPNARSFALLVNWAHVSVGGTQTVKFADAFARYMPKSLLARTWLVDAVWFNQERGRTADLLQSLDAEFGEALPFIRLRQTRFHQQQGLKQRARDRLLELTKAHPTVRDAWDQLAETWRSEGWVEDELAVLKERRRRFGTTAEDLLEVARAYQRLGRRQEMLSQYDELLEEVPFHAEALRRLSETLSDAGDFSGAEKALLLRLESWPLDVGTWLQLGEVRRRRGDVDGARTAFDMAEKLSPESSVPAERRGALAYETGDTTGAVKEWKHAIELNPENESLSNRVDYLAPEARGPWMADMPDEATLNALVKSRDALKQVPGADVAWLLDHEVTLLNSDGSTSNVVSIVVHAWNAQGRDRIIRQSVGAGRLRLLHAFAVDEKGQRSEASSERNRQIFFRGMQPGSTLVLQYRLDTPPKGYLARYFTESWSFQGVAEQRRESTFILWAPLGAQLHEARVGAELSRTEEKRGEHLRVVWQAKDVAPVTVEPNMPTIGELSLNIRLSTVPDWKTWLSWEQALLEGVFRDSPELEFVARKLASGNPDTEEKFKRIHAFVMEEIRYQQDYESFIAGVKPHAAPVVLERRYGDCKDKAVLFIELAKKLGLSAHFALVRTRDVGPIARDVPMQQFNHAIVYVPEQPGMSARFFDPTAELLDLDSIRSDDVGTWSLVFDPESGVHTWREIPWQAPELNAERTAIELDLDDKGGATGTLTIEAVGRGGSMLRRTARNTEIFKQASQRIASLYLPNATTTNPRALEVENLMVPAAIRMDVASGTFARAEADTLRIKLPSDANPRSTFQLASRKYPLVLGTPQASKMELTLALPKGWVVKKLPSSTSVSLPCVSLSREVKTDGSQIKSTQTYRTTCERIGVNEYLQYRARLDDMVRLLEDELVLAPQAASKAGKAPVGSAARH